MTLLHLRDIADNTGAEFSIVSEILDDRNRELAEVARVDDMIVSDRLISLMLAQISENRHLKALFADLFAAEGSEVYLKPLADYVNAGERGELCDDLRGRASPRRGGDRGTASPPTPATPHAAYGIRVNPAKSERLVARARRPGDRPRRGLSLVSGRGAGRPGA